MPRLIDAYTISPKDIAPGDEMCFVIKALVVGRDDDGTLRYRLYRCSWEGTIDDLPQGSRLDNPEELCRQVFPSLAAVGKPDIF